MGTLTINFVGVCVHVREGRAGVEHRIVMINAQDREEIQQHVIDPHRTQLDLGAIGTPPPGGAMYSILHAGEHVAYDATFESCIPRLAEFTDERPLPQLSDAMVSGKDKTLASAYFDAAGTFSAEVTSGGASFARLAVTTDGPPILRIVPFDSTLPEEQVPLPDGGEIDFLNITGPESTEHDYDFLLCFRVFERIPDDVRWPTEAKPCTRSNRNYGTIGPGCSNSSYP